MTALCCILFPAALSLMLAGIIAGLIDGYFYAAANRKNRRTLNRMNTER